MCDSNGSVDQIGDQLKGLSLNEECYTDYVDFGEGTSSGPYRSHQTYYPKDSLDRFGDDLIELILSYLSFSSKVSLESVSKQWQRTIFTKQTELQLNRSDTEEQNTLNKLLKEIDVTDYATGFAQYSGLKAIDKKSLEYVLQKCPYIKKIEFQCYVDAEDLEIIGQYCPYLQSLECSSIGLREKSLVEFGIKYGYRLRTMRFVDSAYCSVFLKKFLNYCPNLREVHTDDNSGFICDDNDFLPKLETIKSLDLRTEQLMQLKILADKYFKTMKNMTIYTYHIMGFQLKTAITYLSNFQNIENLELCITLFDEDTQTIDENILEIAKNCSKLKTFNFTANNESVITNRLFYTFGKFNSIEKLSLYCYEVSKTLDGSIDCFKQCPDLKELIIHYKGLTDEFFDGIEISNPNITSIDINSEKLTTDRMVNSVSKLKNFKKLILKQNSNAFKDITDESVCQLINSCEEIETISFNARPNITMKTINTLIETALKRPKAKIEFSCGWSAVGDEANFEQIDANSFADRIPQNLKISIELGQIIAADVVNE